MEDMGASASQTGPSPYGSSQQAVSPVPASVPCAKVVRDGKVAVLVSGGFGAGWYSWNTSHRALLFDPQLVAAVESDDDEAVHARAKEIAPTGYFGGSDGLEVEWVPEGRRFRIDEYDGSESLVLDDGDDWITA